MAGGATPQLWCGGPAHVFLGLGSGGSPLYFGTSEGAPRFRKIKHIAEVRNDLAGDMQSFDRQYLGEMILVSGDFTRWANTLLLQMWSMPNFLTGAPGTNPGGDYGTFLIQEGFAFPLWLQNPYAVAKAAMAGLEAGIHGFAAILIGPDEKTPGMRTNKVRCAWLLHPLFTPDVNNTVRSRLYDFSMAGLPSVS